jgi:hypothetical protein
VIVGREADQYHDIVVIVYICGVDTRTGSRFLDSPRDDSKLFSFFFLDCSGKLCEDDQNLSEENSLYVAAADLPVILVNFVMAVFFFLQNFRSDISDDFLLRPTKAGSSPSVESLEAFTSRYVPLPASTRCQHCPFSRCESLDDY